MKIDDAGIVDSTKTTKPDWEEKFDEKIECPECEGNGIVGNPIWTRFYNKYSIDMQRKWSDKERDNALYEHFGTHYSDRLPSEEIDCDACHGNGKRYRTHEENKAFIRQEIANAKREVVEEVEKHIVEDTGDPNWKGTYYLDCDWNKLKLSLTKGE